MSSVVITVGKIGEAIYAIALGLLALLLPADNGGTWKDG
jgi:hypothetical protein